MTTAESTLTYFDLGSAGYKLGLKAPAQCPEWMRRCERLKAGEGSGAKEWNDGWYAAQLEELKVEFPEMYD